MKKAILCIDDDKTILESLRIQLRNLFDGTYHYDFAESAAEGLEIIDEFNDDGINILLIVSDWLMPGMKGDDFLIEVHKKFPLIKKVLLTGQADQQAIERAKNEANLLACIHKPWDEEDIKNIVIQALEDQ